MKSSSWKLWWADTVREWKSLFHFRHSLLLLFLSFSLSLCHATRQASNLFLLRKQMFFGSFSVASRFIEKKIFVSDAENYFYTFSSQHSELFRFPQFLVERKEKFSVVTVAWRRRTNITLGERERNEISRKLFHNLSQRFFFSCFSFYPWLER